MLQALTSPQIVLQELERVRADEFDESEVDHLETVLAELEKREGRLVRLYTLGEISEAAVDQEAAAISSQQKLWAEKLDSLKRPIPQAVPRVDPDNLAKACAAVAEWLEKAGNSERGLALEALQVAVEATRDTAVVRDVLPTEFEECEKVQFITEEPTSRCSCNGNVAWERAS